MSTKNKMYGSIVGSLVTAAVAFGLIPEGLITDENVNAVVAGLIAAGGIVSGITTYWAPANDP